MAELGGKKEGNKRNDISPTMWGQAKTKDYVMLGLLSALESWKSKKEEERIQQKEQKKREKEVIIKLGYSPDEVSLAEALRRVREKEQKEEERKVLIPLIERMLQTGAKVPPTIAERAGIPELAKYEPPTKTLKEIYTEQVMLNRAMGLPDFYGIPKEAWGIIGYKEEKRKTPEQILTDKMEKNIAKGKDPYYGFSTEELKTVGALPTPQRPYTSPEEKEKQKIEAKKSQEEEKKREALSRYKMILQQDRPLSKSEQQGIEAYEFYYPAETSRIKYNIERDVYEDIRKIPPGQRNREQREKKREFESKYPWAFEPALKRPSWAIQKTPAHQPTIGRQPAVKPEKQETSVLPKRKPLESYFQ